MSNITKSIIAFGAVAGVFGLAAFFGYTPFLKTFGSPAGSTFNSAKVAMINIAPVSSAASSTSILNTDGSARWVEYPYGSCTGTGSESVAQAALGFTAATTTVSSLGSQGNSNVSARITIATSTAFSNNASTTVNTNFLSYWPAGTYLTFTFTATTSAACTVGVSYLAS